MVNVEYVDGADRNPPEVHPTGVFLADVPPFRDDFFFFRRRSIFRTHFGEFLQQEHDVAACVEFRNEEAQIDAFALDKRELIEETQ